jgi:hypothetical protein
MINLKSLIYKYMKIKTVRKGARATNKRMRRRRRVNAKTRRNRTRSNRNRRGGSTTEQIGAAAQMRAYFPYNVLKDHPVHQALNDIVHHENSSNRFYDPTFSYNPYAQNAIDDAYRIINDQTEHEQAIKDQLLIAKRKAKRSNGLPLPQNVVQPKSSDPVEDFPGIPVLPMPVKVPVPYVGPAPVHVPVASIHAPHLEKRAAEVAIMYELPAQVAMNPPPPPVGNVNAAATQGLLSFLAKNR